MSGDYGEPDKRFWRVSGEGWSVRYTGVWE